MELRYSAGSADPCPCLIAARYSGVKLDAVADDSSPVLVLKTQKGHIRGATAALRYIGRLNPTANLEGRGWFGSAQVDQWVEFADNEMCYVEGTTAEAAAHLTKVMSILENHLVNKTFLEGERITMADIAVACALVRSGHRVSELVSVERWLDTCRNQPQFRVVLEAMKENGRPLPKASTTDLGAVEESQAETLASSGRAVGGMDIGEGKEEGEKLCVVEGEEENAALAKLAQLGVEYVTYAHRAANTVEEQMAVIGGLEGQKTKNLFLRDKKAGLFLVTVRHDRPTDTKILAKLLGLTGKVRSME
ncbi:unnamed protein product [Discosporangium mesarthrocarpum]